MKIFVLKLCSLVTLIVGVAGFAYILRLAPLFNLLEENAHLLPATPEESILRFTAWLGVMALVILLGVYGFVPKFGKNKAKTREIHFAGEHGDVVIQLDSVQRALTNVIGRMPEIKRVQVHVEPDKEGTRALINADVVIYSNPDVRARQTANDVTEYIAQSAIQILGLEDLATIKLNVVGFEVNPKLASKQIREECKQRMEASKRPKLTYEPAVAIAPEPSPAPAPSSDAIMAAAAATAPAPGHEAEAEEISTYPLDDLESETPEEVIHLEEPAEDLSLMPLEEEPVDEEATDDDGLSQPESESDSKPDDESPTRKSWFS